MDYQEYLKENKELYDILLQYIEDEANDDDYFQQLLNTFEKQQILESKDEITFFLRLLISLSNNHHRHHCFLIQKIEKILRHMENSIKENFSNLELFTICKSSKLIVLFFIKLQMIVIDNIIAQKIIYRSQKTNTKYHQYFYPEIKKYLDKYQLKEIKIDINEKDINDFENKRIIGENDNYICELIRNDSIEEFIPYVNRLNIALSKTIKQSIFETNNFLMKNEPTFIEYASFYGSIQIFQYLKYNDVEMNPSIWLYAIHGRSPEIIHILEENHIEPPNGTYNECYCESIKCHHNDIANYINDVLLDDEIINYKQIFQYYNIKYIPLEEKNNSVFFYLCRYDYKKYIELYIKPKQEIMKDRMAEIKT